MSANLPRVSALMSVHNGEPYLSDSIESILNQTYTDFEFIIIDDGSTDDSLEVIRQYSREDERIRYFAQENIGLTPTLNRGITKARGEYLARMDDDDVSLPDRLETQVEYLDFHKDVVAVGGQVLLIDQDGNLLKNYNEYPISDEDGQMKGLYENHTEIDNALLIGEWPLVQSACLFRTNAVKNVNGYDEKYKANQDHDLFLKLAETGLLRNIPKVVVKYRRHNSQVTVKENGRNFDNILRLKTIRREAFKRRNIKIPRELKLTALVKIKIKANLSKLKILPYLQKVKYVFNH